MTDQRVVQNETEDLVFKFSHASNPYLSRLVWTGTKLTNFSELTDEYGDKFTLQEFLPKLGAKRYVHGNFFPTAVEMTRNLKLKTSFTNEKCICLCKTIDIPFWKGWRYNKKGPMTMTYIGDDLCWRQLLSCWWPILHIDNLWKNFSHRFFTYGNQHVQKITEIIILSSLWSTKPVFLWSLFSHLAQFNFIQPQKVNSDSVDNFDNSVKFSCVFEGSTIKTNEKEFHQGSNNYNSIMSHD